MNTRNLAFMIGLYATAASAQQASPGSNQAGTDAIRRVNQEWTEAIEVGDIERIMAPLTADFALLPPGGAADSGSAAVRAWTRRMVDQGAYTEVTTSQSEAP